MKNLAKLISITTLLSTSAFADGNGPSNLRLDEAISSSSSKHHISKSVFANNDAEKEIRQVFTEIYNNQSAMINENFKYLTDGTSAPLVAVKACSSPNKNNDYVAHNSQVQLNLQVNIAEICKRYGYSSVNINFGAYPGSQMSYNNIENNNNGVLNELYYIKTVSGDKKLVMMCGFTHGLCAGKSRHDQ
jgi:hypothetical protein